MDFEVLMNLGILNCDRVSDEFAIHYGQYPDMFVALLQPIAPKMTFTVFNVIDGELPKDVHAADAYLITGSKYGVNDDYRWIASLQEFVRVLHATPKKVIGICFGHQLIAKALGGTVIKSPKGWGIGVLQTQIVHHKKWMHPARSHFNLLASHQDQVVILPPGAQLLAGSEFCPNNMMQIGDTMLGLQGHPEFTKAYAKDLMQSRENIIEKKVIARGLQSLKLEHEHDLIAQWLIHFLDNSK
jgi:GMP synthase-like glutamine amidotransferase